MAQHRRIAVKRVVVMVYESEDEVPPGLCNACGGRTAPIVVPIQYTVGTRMSVKPFCKYCRVEVPLLEAEAHDDSHSGVCPNFPANVHNCVHQCLNPYGHLSGH
jgi:hypothetical protein